MYIPKFPYSGNQSIITSDRVTLLAKTDSVFVFGKEAVSLSSQGTVNIDAKEKLAISSPIIELGLNASAKGEPAVLGDSLVTVLDSLVDSLSAFAQRASTVTADQLSTLESGVGTPADALYKSLKDIRNGIDNTTRSSKVFIQKNNI